jgi:hypothetical protein
VISGRSVCCMTRGTQHFPARGTLIHDTRSWCFWKENFDIWCLCACDHIQYKWQSTQFYSRMCQHLFVTVKVKVTLEHSTYFLRATSTLILPFTLKIKVKFNLQQFTKALRGSTGIAVLFLQPRRQVRWVVNATTRPVYLPGKTRYPLYRRLGGPEGRFGRVRKISPVTGIRSPDRPACSGPFTLRKFFSASLCFGTF